MAMGQKIKEFHFMKWIYSILAVSTVVFVIYLFQGDAVRELWEKLSEKTEHGLVVNHLSKDVFKLFSSTVIGLTGLSILISAVVISILDKDSVKDYVSCAGFLIVGGLWTVFEYEFVRKYYNDNFFVNTMDVISQMFLCEFLLIYLKCYYKSKLWIRIGNGIVGCWSLGILIFYILHMMGMINPKDAEYKIAVIILEVVMIAVVGFYKEYRRSKNRDMLIILVMGNVMALSAIFRFANVGTERFWIYAFMIEYMVFAVIQVNILIGNARKRLMHAVSERELELRMAKNREAVVRSQIQPHFLYNALATIRSLCTKDPELARTAIDYFSAYLRANMNSLDTTECIPFETELAHVKSYLYIEKLRFGDRLQIEYDIQTMRFMCPPLALQTMVENAVKHGVCNKRGGGLIRITVRELKNRFEICVEDDGVGFDIKKMPEDGRKHIGIQNTRSRLKYMCNGVLKIESELEKGTKVNIHIPKETGKLQEIL